MVQLEFTKIRDVKSPNRANDGDAGLDFYIPKLYMDDILKVEKNTRGISLVSIVECSAMAV